MKSDPSPSPAPRRRGRPKSKASEDVGRARLIDAARTIFASDDPLKINRRLFAEKAGVDPNLVRYYFGDMRSLIGEVLAETHRRARSQILGLENDIDPEERLRLRIKKTFELFRDQPHHHQMVRAVIYENPDGKDHQDWEALLQDAVADLEDLLCLGVDRGQMRKGVDAPALHLLIVAACEFWTTNEPVLSILFRPRKAGNRLDKYFVSFLQDLVMAALRPT